MHKRQHNGRFWDVKLVIAGLGSVLWSVLRDSMIWSPCLLEKVDGLSVSRALPLVIVSLRLSCYFVVAFNRHDMHSNRRLF